MNLIKLQMDVKYDYLEKINVPEIVKNCTDKWFNQSLCNVNSSVFRLGIFEGEYHLHKLIMMMRCFLLLRVVLF